VGQSVHAWTERRTQRPPLDPALEIVRDSAVRTVLVRLTSLGKDLVHAWRVARVRRRVSLVACVFVWLPGCSDAASPDETAGAAAAASAGSAAANLGAGAGAQSGFGGMGASGMAMTASSGTMAVAGQAGNAGHAGSTHEAAGSQSAGAGPRGAGTSGTLAGQTAGMPASGASAAGAGMASDVTPQLRSSKYVLEFADVLVEVDPAQGARISRCELAGQSLLTGPDVDSINWGSTFWPSPQERWTWPPVPELDSQAYSGGIEGKAIVLHSAVGQRAKLSVSKRFSAFSASRLLEITYTLKNEDTVMASWSPWEISRVPPRGLTFFPTGERSVNTQLQLMTNGGVSWFQHDPAALNMGSQKFTGDGTEGWLAHVAGDKLLLKTFDDVPIAQQAPSPEGEIEIYAAATYVEVEPQGPFTQLAPGQSLEWSVRWYLRQLPSDVTVGVGSASLLAFVRDITAPAQP